MDDDETKLLPVVFSRENIDRAGMSDVGKLKAAEYVRRLRAGETFTEPQGKPMKSLGRGCAEIRFDDGPAEKSFRIIYYRDRTVLFVMAVGEKKSQKTPKRMLDACEKRLKEFKKDRKGKK